MLPSYFVLLSADAFNNTDSPSKVIPRRTKGFGFFYTLSDLKALSDIGGVGLSHEERFIGLGPLERINKLEPL